MLKSELYLHGQPKPLEVAAFQGAEALSQSFVLHVSVRPEEALSALELPLPAALLLDSRGSQLLIHGLLTQVIRSTPDEWRLVLQSPLELLDTAAPELEFDGMDAPQAIAGLLAGLGYEPGKDFGFHLADSYDPWPALRTEGDSPFDFLFRLLAREGICCLHESTDQGGMLVFSDDPARLSRTVDLQAVDEPRSGRELLPAEVRVSGGFSGSGRQPLQCVRPVPSGGRGRVAFSDQRLRSAADAERLARILAEQVHCAGWKISGRTGRPLRPGICVRDVGGQLGQENELYLITAVVHQADFRDGSGYGCRFQAVPATVRFRPQPNVSRKALRAHIRARVDLEKQRAACAVAYKQLRIEEKLLDISGMQLGMVMRLLEILATRLAGELDAYVREIQNQLLRLESMEYGLQEADRLRSEQAWLRQRYCEERISLNQTLESWGEDGESIVL